MHILKSLVCGQLSESELKTAELVNPATEEVIAKTSTAHIDFGAALDYARTVGDKALRGLTFAGRGQLLAYAQCPADEIPGSDTLGSGSYTTDFLVDSVFLSSPYASSFGGFVNLETSLWFGGGGVLGSLINTVTEQTKAKPKEGELAGEALPEDMGAVSLVGGGLIAGDALAALGFGVYALVSKLLAG